jgi:hypothetical protein
MKHYLPANHTAGLIVTQKTEYIQCICIRERGLPHDC